MSFRYALLVPRSARSLAWFGILIGLTISLFAFIGWVLNITLLKSIEPQWIPMKVTTAICLALLAIELIFLQKNSQGPHNFPIALQIPGILVSLVGLLTISLYSITIITGKEISPGGTLFQDLLWAPATRMSLLTAILFLINGIVLTLLMSGNRRAANIAHAVMVPAIMASYLIPVTYLLGVQGLHESLNVPVALNTGICFCALGVAVFCVRPDTWLMKVFTGDHAGGLIARRLLPGLLLIPIVIGYLRLYGERSGAFVSEVGVVLVALTYTVCLLGLVWITARSVSKTDDRRRKAEEALHREHDFVSAVLDTAGAIVVVLDRQGRITRFNRACELITGYTASEVLGRVFWEFLVPPENLAGVKETWEALNAGQFPNRHENHWQARDGSRRLIDWANTALTDPAGELQHIIGTGIDITEQKRAEESLRESEQRWATTLASIGDAVIATDMAGNITFINAVAEELTGWTLSEASLMPVAEVFKIINQQTHQAVDCPVARVLREGMIIGLANHTILVRKDGTEVPIDDSGAPIRDAEGKTMGVVLVFRDITERKRLEKDLNKRQIELQSLFNHSNAGLVLFDGKPPYTVLAHNRYYQELFAEPFRTQGMVGKNVYEYAPEVEAQGVVAVFEEALRTKKAVNLLDFPYDTNPPEKSWFNWHLSPVIHEDEVVALASMSINVTNQHVAEEALRESEERYRTLFENAPDALVVHRDGRFLNANDAALRLLGVGNFEELANHTVLDFFKPIEREQAVERIRQAMEGRTLPIRETTLRRLDGQEVVVEFRTAPVDFQGTPAIQTITRDITERKQGEEALRESEERMNRAQEIAHLGSWELDVVNNRLSWSDEVYRIFGLKPQEFGATYDAFLEAVHPDDRTAVDAAYSGSLREGRDTYEIEHRIVRKSSGEVRIVHEKCDHIRDEFGRIIRSTGMVHDITERKQAEEALQKAHAELELRVQERTAELDQAYEALQAETAEREQTQEQLRQSQKMEALGILTGGIAHDFNNILSAIIGFAEMAADDVPKESQTAHSLWRVLQASSRGRDLIKQMLTFSRKTEAEKKPLRLSSLINETMKLIRASIPTTISIRVNLKSDSALISADPTQIQQVLLNLCTNAAYAMGEQGGVLDVELSECILSDEKNDQMKPGSYLKLVVRDTGVGIPPEHMDKIFDPFFTTKQLGEGTGLGLSVVHGIVHQHEGHITVESEPGKGAVFSLYFPRIIEEASIDAVIEETVIGGHERILFIDDEELIMEMGQMVLERLGYEVVSLTSSNEALSLFRDDPAGFDLVITDQTMPEMTGVELAKEILAVRPDMPVILCTGFSHLVDAEAAKAAGIRTFAMKPMTKREIAKTIRKVLDE